MWLVSAWQGDHGNQHVAGPNCETHFWVQVMCDRCIGFPGNMDEKFVLKGTATGWSDASCPHCNPEPRSFSLTSAMSWNTSVTYSIELSWNEDGVSLSIDQPGGKRSAGIDFCWPQGGGSPGTTQRTSLVSTVVIRWKRSMPMPPWIVVSLSKG
ncbi:MAG: hypothetical protein GXP49_08710 [Deltaproteobacteria bacterium]|nr:hypothetical protein [Deltaproteobacteria bacterium]